MNKYAGIYCPSGKEDCIGYYNPKDAGREDEFDGLCNDCKDYYLEEKR